jgi:hypothetical protein
MENFLYKRNERTKKIVDFLAAINACTIIEKIDRRKNRIGKTSYVKFSPNFSEKLEVGECYIDELDFDINLIRLWALVEIIEEQFNYSLTVSITECYWTTDLGVYVTDQKFRGKSRAENIFCACMGIINLIKID